NRGVRPEAAIGNLKSSKKTALLTTIKMLRHRVVYRPCGFLITFADLGLGEKLGEIRSRTQPRDDRRAGKCMDSAPIFPKIPAWFGQAEIGVDESGHKV